MKPQADLGGELADTQGNTKSKTFTSRDQYVGETATAIEAQFPGRVEAVNENIYENGVTKVEVDVVLDNTAIQVKSGGARNLVGQLQDTALYTGKTAIGYTPDLKPNSPQIRAANKEGFKVFTTQKSLLRYLEKNQSK